MKIQVVTHAKGEGSVYELKKPPHNHHRICIVAPRLVTPCLGDTAETVSPVQGGLVEPSPGFRGCVISGQEQLKTKSFIGERGAFEAAPTEGQPQEGNIVFAKLKTT